MGSTPDRHYKERGDNNSDSNSDSKDKFWAPAGADPNWVPAFLDPNWTENNNNYIDTNSDSDDRLRTPAPSACNGGGSAESLRGFFISGRLNHITGRHHENCQPN